MAEPFLWHAGVWPGFAPQPGVAWPRLGPVEHAHGWGGSARSYEGAVARAVRVGGRFVRPVDPVLVRHFPYDRLLVVIARRCDDCIGGVPRDVLERQRVTGNYRLGRRQRCRECDGAGCLWEAREDVTGERLESFLRGEPIGMKAA